MLKHFIFTDVMTTLEDVDDQDEEYASAPSSPLLCKSQGVTYF